MRSLKNILNENKMHSVEAARAYIDEKKEGALEVVSKEDLSLCSESRIYEDVIEYNNKIIDVDHLWVANSNKVKFINCIFMGSLLVSQKHGGVCDVYIDGCIFVGGLKIVGLMRSESIVLVLVNAPSISIENNEVGSVLFQACRACKFVVLDNKAREFRVSQSKINYPFVSRNDFREVSFYYDQVDYNKFYLFRKIIKMERDAKIFSCFEYDYDVNFESLSLSEKRQINLDTLRFILRDSDVSIDKSAKAHVRYLESIESHGSLLSRSAFWIFGGLLKPVRLFVIISMIIVVFGMIYQMPFLFFDAPGDEAESVVRNLTVVEGLYYSGVTFTTIGYGDISPTGMARFFSVVEGVLGVLLSSAFLVSLVRKYIE